MEVDEASKTATPSLFLLQVTVETLSLTLPSVARGTASPSSYLLAFQLLQFDLVLFDTSTLSERDGVVEISSTEDDAAEGRSCLFESDAKHLAQQIQADVNAALVLLMLQRDAQRAKLLAFACVRVELPHLAFMGERKWHMPRVSEWVSVEGTWPLVDHQHTTLGSISGRVTLACLGRALAPHLASQRFGGSVQMLTTARMNDMNERETPVKQENTQESTNSAVKPCEKASVVDAALSPMKPPDSQTEKLKQEDVRDAAIQCSSLDGEDEPLNRQRHPKPILIRCGSSASRATDYSPRHKIVDELDRIRSRATTSPRLGAAEKIQSRRDRHRGSSETYESMRRSLRQQHQRYTETEEAELPPPLYFHKPKRQPKM